MKIALPSTDGRSRMHALMGFHAMPTPARSASTTVQAPQSPSAQPSFVPVRRRSSRRYSSSVVCGDWPPASTRSPFSRKRMDSRMRR